MILVARGFSTAFSPLCDLTKEEQWPSERWRVALQVWSEKDQVLRGWRFAGPLVQTMPEDTSQEIARNVSWWLNEVSKSIDRNENILMNICGRILDHSYFDNVDTDQPVTPGNKSSGRTSYSGTTKSLVQARSKR